MEDKIAKLILEALMKQTFVDWYEIKFVPNYVEEHLISEEEILEQIKKVFRIGE